MDNPLRVPLSILDLLPISEGMTRTGAMDASLKLAQVADRYGYHRYWAAEHHGSQLFMASATSVILARAAERTKRIRIGAGGVMMPNHVPFMVAENYGTLATMFPDRIDLGIGRAPGTDPVTASVLRRGSSELRDYAADIAELVCYLEPKRCSGENCPDEDAPKSLSGAEAGAVGIEYKPAVPVQRVRAIPGEGTEVPIWMLGSSTGGARVAAALGLPYSFASHFAPDLAHEAMDLYRAEFQADAPTAQVDKPYVMGGVMVMCAPTEEEATYLLSSVQQTNVLIKRGIAAPLPAPVSDLASVMSADEIDWVRNKAGLYAVGTPAQVAEQLEKIVEQYGFDELILLTFAFNPLMRRRSYQLLAREWGIAQIYSEEE